MRPKLHSSSRPFKDFIDRFSNSRAFRPKRKRSSNSVAYETLEPKQLLATLVASYSADFPSPGGSAESGWQYQWNAPVNGNNGSGAIDNPQTQFAQMQDTGIATSWTPDGDLIATTNPSAAYVRLTSAGGHPGLGEFSGRAGRYAIASYTVSDSGFYSIDNSYVGLSPLNTSRTNDGVEFRVFVNRDAPVEQGAVDPFTKSYFDTELGFLAAGDTVHVAFGSNGTAFADFFTMDYDIVRAVELEDNVGNFRSDFLTQPASDTDGYGWNYYWNAPDGWIGDGQTGNQRSGAIGDASSYEQLRLVDSIWTADGDLNGLNSRPDYFLKVDPTGGQAGNGFASAVLQDRFAISGYTIEHSGLYAISDSFLSVAENSDDGVEVYIHVGTGDQLNERTIVAGGDSSSFDTELGYLKKGDTIYVGFGANGNHLFDRYETDFSVVRHLPRAAPDLSVLEQTGEVVHVGASHFGQPGAVINDNRNDWQAIKNAFQHALDIEAHEVRFEPGIYNLTSTGLSDTDPFFELERFSNLVINGNGATFISGDFGRSIINVHFASNVVIQDLTIDYAERVPATNGQTNDLYKPLTFTQGRITEVDHEANTFTVSVNTDAFVRPDSSFSTNGENGWGYAIDPFVDGRLKPNTDWHYPTLGVENGAKTDHFVVSTIDTEGLESGDRYVLIRRRNNSAIGFYNGSSNVSVIGVTAYSSPSVFVASIGSDSVNVIDSSVEIRPDDWPGVAETGRWKSINGDGVHIQSSRNGAWVENSSFDGLGDDVMNFYSLPMTVLEKVSTNSFTVAMLVRDRLASISNAFIQPGDTLRF